MLLKCPECGAPVIDRVDACRECGCPIDYIKSHQRKKVIQLFSATTAPDMLFAAAKQGNAVQCIGLQVVCTLEKTVSK